MQFLRKLIESKPFFSCVPRPDLIENNTLVATGDAEGSFALVYLPRGGKVEVKLELLRSASEYSWFDPRTGETMPATHEDNVFNAPDERDWVLCLDVA